MIYLVKNKSGAENQVTKKIYDDCNGKDEYECRIVGAEPVKPLEPIKVKEEWPKKDENSSWYTLSNGKRIQGEEKAMKAESELDG